jgi:hypothetical protein
VTHWHIIASTGAKEKIAAARYDNAAKSINDFIEVVFDVYDRTAQISNVSKNEYMEWLLSLSENESGYHVYANSRQLILSWKDCEYDPCSLAIYN